MVKLLRMDESNPRMGCGVLYDDRVAMDAASGYNVAGVGRMNMRQG
jgi:hypothetical protein